MKRIRISGLLFAVILCACSTLSPSANYAEALNDVYWINPDGGIHYHKDPNCRSIHPRYLPLTVSITAEDLNKQPYNQLSPCHVCMDENVIFKNVSYMDGSTLLESILTAYEGRETVLSDQIEIVWHDVNFRKSPGGEVLGRLQGGDILDCIDEMQYKGELWYHARSSRYGEGYVICTFAKPLWNNLVYWPLNDDEDIISDNMVLYSYWMGSYQLDHGLSIIEDVGSDRMLSIAPLSVRGDMSVIPEDARIQIAVKLFEYGFICKNDAYEKLIDDTKSLEERNQVASSVLQNHYGTDDIWDITVRTSIALFIHVNDLHTEGQLSGRDNMILSAVQKRLVDEH